MTTRKARRQTTTKIPKTTSPKSAVAVKVNKPTPIEPLQKVGPKQARATTLVGPSKQAKVIALLRAPAGMTIDAIVKATGWQQHSVRGFLAGVVRKKLALDLVSETGKNVRLYRIKGDNSQSGANVKAGRA